MKRFLKPMLTVPTLDALGGDYEGVIATVQEETIRNRFKGQQYQEAVLTFQDGMRMVLNKTMLTKCIGWFGSDSLDWTGRRIWVFLRKAESINKATGETRTQVQRGIACEDPHAKGPSLRGTASIEALREREPGEDDDVLDGEGVALTGADIFESHRRRLDRQPPNY